MLSPLLVKNSHQNSFAKVKQKHEHRNSLPMSQQSHTHIHKPHIYTNTICMQKNAANNCARTRSPRALLCESGSIRTVIKEFLSLLFAVVFVQGVHAEPGLILNEQEFPCMYTKACSVPCLSGSCTLLQGGAAHKNRGVTGQKCFSLKMSGYHKCTKGRNVFNLEINLVQFHFYKTFGGTCMSFSQNENEFP